jgi:hypothetical protein
MSLSAPKVGEQQTARRTSLTPISVKRHNLSFPSYRDDCNLNRNSRKVSGLPPPTCYPKNRGTENFCPPLFLLLSIAFWLWVPHPSGFSHRVGGRMGEPAVADHSLKQRGASNPEPEST